MITYGRLAKLPGSTCIPSKRLSPFLEAFHGLDWVFGSSTKNKYFTISVTALIVNLALYRILSSGDKHTKGSPSPVWFSIQSVGRDVDVRYGRFCLSDTFAALVKERD